jgi:hypothetical protein
MKNEILEKKKNDDGEKVILKELEKLVVIEEGFKAEDKLVLKKSDEKFLDVEKKRKLLEKENKIDENKKRKFLKEDDLHLDFRELENFKVFLSEKGADKFIEEKISL